MPRIFVAIPALNESEYLPNTLKCLQNQIVEADVEVYICVNQPENFWNDSSKKHICIDNARTLEYLKHYDFLTLHVIDRSSRGFGWQGKKSGVGFARKVLFDSILEVASDDDIVVSLDSDTTFDCNYLNSLLSEFSADKRINAISVPYFHRLENRDAEADIAVLLYEIYMRNYLINLLKIRSPYAFSALGSAIAVRASALKKIGGITPYQSGEDFYLLQKIAKMGGLSVFNTECVYPSSRKSDRVPFGTGPSVKSGKLIVKNNYPIYHYSYFSKIEQTYSHLQQLYVEKYFDCGDEFLNFLDETGEIIVKLKKNVSDFEHFEKAFHQYADGLRILQFVRKQHTLNKISPEIALKDNVNEIFFEKIDFSSIQNKILEDISIDEADKLRVAFWEQEMKMRKQTHIL